MKYYNNEYESLASVFNKNLFTVWSANHNYAKCQKSKTETLNILKNKIVSNPEFSQEYKDVVNNNANIKVCCFYASKYEVSADIYCDKYEEYDNGYVPDAWGGYYKEYLTRFVGRIKQKTLKCSGSTQEYNILKPEAADYVNYKDDDYNIIFSSYKIEDDYNDMINSEKNQWQESVGHLWDEIKNKKIECWHIPFIAIKCKYDGKEIVSWINASTLKVYIGGYFNNATIFKQMYNEAQNGDAEKMYILGNECYRGKYSKKDFKEAIKWLTLSADKKNVHAATLLGALYYGKTSEGIEEDKHKAYKYTKFAADKESNVACYNLGIFYEYGVGTDVDYTKAILSYKEATKLGYRNTDKEIEEIAERATDGNAINYAGEHFESAKDMKKAFKYYEKAANVYNNAEAMFNLSKCYKNLTGPLASIYDSNKSKELYEKALALGSSSAKEYSGRLQIARAEVLVENKEACHTEEAIKAYLKVIDTKSLDVKIKYILAQHYESGIYVGQDIEKALSLYAECYDIKKGLKELKYYAKQHYMPAYYYLGQYYNKLNKKKVALNWFYKSGKLGYYDAINEISKAANVSLYGRKFPTDALKYLRKLAKMKYETAIVGLLKYLIDADEKYKSLEKKYDKLDAKKAFRPEYYDETNATNFTGKLRKNRYQLPLSKPNKQTETNTENAVESKGAKK